MPRCKRQLFHVPLYTKTWSGIWATFTDGTQAGVKVIFPLNQKPIFSSRGRYQIFELEWILLAISSAGYVQISERVGW